MVGCGVGGRLLGGAEVVQFSALAPMLAGAGHLGGSGDDCPEPAIRVDADESAVMVISTDANDPQCMCAAS